jgi:hypothetical protein
MVIDAHAKVFFDHIFTSTVETTTQAAQFDTEE